MFMRLILGMISLYHLCRQIGVTCPEGVHVRDIACTPIEQPLNALVIDVSFISLKQALPPSIEMLADTAHDWLL